MVFLQYDPQYDRLHFLHEVYPTLNKEEVPGVNTQSLCSLVQADTKRLFGEVYDGAPVRDFVDPAGNQHKETSDYSSIEMLQEYGFNAEWNVLGRKNRINYARRWIEGGPDRLAVNPHCTLAIKAFSKAYRYPEENKGSVDRDMPDLSKRVQEEPYIHIMDAFEYIVAGALQFDDINDSRAWSRNEEEEQLIGDLAEMYLRSASMEGVYDRTAGPNKAPYDEWSDYELRPSDLIGEDDLADAWEMN